MLNLPTGPAVVQRLSGIKAGPITRLPSGVREWDNVLNGGIIKGSCTLFGGAPGSGKSTIMLQVATGIAKATGRPALYSALEESPESVRRRIDRAAPGGAQHILVSSDRDVRQLSQAITDRLSLVVVDSLQELEVPWERGTLLKAESATDQLCRVAHETEVPIVMIGHVTKGGLVAGSRRLQHMVDGVFLLLSPPARMLRKLSEDYRQRARNHRFLQAEKHRDSDTQYVGVFAVSEQGLRGYDGQAEAIWRHGWADWWKEQG